MRSSSSSSTPPRACSRRTPAETTPPEGRIFRFGIGWDAIEETPDHYNFRFWDEIVDTAARRKVTLIPYVAYTPAWIASGVTDTWRRPPRGR